MEQEQAAKTRDLTDQQPKKNKNYNKSQRHQISAHTRHQIFTNMHGSDKVLVQDATRHVDAADRCDFQRISPTIFPFSCSGLPAQEPFTVQGICSPHTFLDARNNRPKICRAEEGCRESLPLVWVLIPEKPQPLMDCREFARCINA